MTPTLVHAVARRAEAITPDADLLARYTRDRDHPAFEELVRRHGPLVWAVCRHLLPHHADAEDAFQAVFLALVRSAPAIRDGRTVPAWLHAVAVRVATRARREFARRRARERAAAVPEADRPVPDAAWEGLVAAVHEEVQRLPAAERTAFVLCDLQGVSQPDAAARLGWPLGSVSGRLCKARQRLLDRLAARGVAPAAVVGVGLTAGAAGAVPAELVNAVKSFPLSPGAASTAAAALARGLTEGVAMRVKLVAAAGVMVAALGLTGGAVVLSTADAQPPAVVKEVKGLLDSADDKRPGGGGGAPGAPGAFGGGGGAPPGAGALGPVAGGGPGGGVAAWAGAPATWEYKFVDLKNDRKVFEQTITQHGKEGWEFCGSERFDAGPGGRPGELTLVFKKRKGGDFGVQGGFGPAMGGAMGGMGMGMMAPGGAGPNWRDWVGGAGGGTGGMEARVFTLTTRKADDVVKAISEAHPKAVKVVGEPRTNMVIVVADPATMKQITALIEELDAKPGNRPKPGPMGAGAAAGAGSGSGGPPPGMMGGAPQPLPLTIFQLKNAKAEEVALVLKKLFRTADIEGYPVGNSIIVRADEKTLDELRALLTKLDVEVPKPR
jgi:RNA polymerase sigma factor (sigma-70 family)